MNPSFATTGNFATTTTAPPMAGFATTTGNFVTTTTAPPMKGFATTTGNFATTTTLRPEKVFATTTGNFATTTAPPMTQIIWCADGTCRNVDEIRNELQRAGTQLSDGTLFGTLWPKIEYKTTAYTDKKVLELDQQIMDRLNGPRRTSMQHLIDEVNHRIDDTDQKIQDAITAIDIDKKIQDALTARDIIKTIDRQVNGLKVYVDQNFQRVSRR